VKLKGDPLLTDAGALRLKCVAAAALTVTGRHQPFRPSAASVAITR
jgi:hypothetical protein